MNGAYSRRRLLQLAGSTAALGVAGCSNDAGGGSGAYSHLPAALRGELPSPDQYIPEDGQRSQRTYGTVRVDTEAGRFVLENQSVIEPCAVAGSLLAEDLAPTESWKGDLEAEDGRLGGAALATERTLEFAPESFQGLALRAAAAIDVVIDGERVAARARTVRYHVDEGRFLLSGTPRSLEASNDPVTILQQEVPDPETFLVGRHADFERSAGTFAIDDESGLAFLRGPGAEQVTAVEGYILVDGLEASDGWNGVADPFTGQIGTHSVAGPEGLSFEPGTFDGIALRATAGIELVTREGTIVEDAQLIRYHVDEGVLETQ